MSSKNRTANTVATANITVRIVPESSMLKLKGSEKLYRESIEASRAFNKQLINDRKNRIPYLDGQTRVAQGCTPNMWLHEYQRREPTRLQQLKNAKTNISNSKSSTYSYSYPMRRWSFKNRRIVTYDTTAATTPAAAMLTVNDSSSSGNLYRLLQNHSSTGSQSSINGSNGGLVAMIENGLVGQTPTSGVLTNNGPTTQQSQTSNNSNNNSNSNHHMNHHLNENSNSMDSMSTLLTTTTPSVNASQVLLKHLSGNLTLAATAAASNDEFEASYELTNHSNSGGGVGNHGASSSSSSSTQHHHHNHHHHQHHHGNHNHGNHHQQQQQPAPPPPPPSFYSVDDSFDNFDAFDNENESDHGDNDYEDSSTKRRKKKPAKPRKKADTTTTTTSATAGGEKPFACEQCGMKYKTKPGLSYHIKSAHSSTGQQSQQQQQQQQPLAPPSQSRSALASLSMSGDESVSSMLDPSFLLNTNNTNTNDSFRRTPNQF